MPLAPDPDLPGPSSKRYEALDGLRGLAVLLVIAFHGAPHLVLNDRAERIVAACNFGWIGVDVFFVLSGFLITGILLDSRGGPGYFRNFYGRRVLRIIPAYYLMLAIVFGALPLVVPFDSPELRRVAANQGWLWAHLTNWGYLWHGGVFTVADWLNLDHLWSLAVEEQFYLVWPVVVMFAAGRRFKLVCFTLIAGSLLLRVGLWTAGARTGALYYPTPCRLDGLAIGALVAVWQRETGGLSRRLTVARGAAGACLAAILALALWRGGFRLADPAAVALGSALASMLAACCIMLVVQPHPRGALAGTLKLSILRAAGTYSYGAYLYHNLLVGPLVIALPPKHLAAAAGSAAAANVLFALLYVGASFAAAIVSWHVLEKHCLTLKTRFDYRQ